jgi:hypothetical protein
MRSPLLFMVVLAIAVVGHQRAIGGAQRAATGAASQPSVNPRAAATKAFVDRIKQYVDFHNNVEKMVPPLRETPEPKEIATREAALGAALIKQRPDAKEGDFFVAQYRPYLVKIIKDDFAKRSLADRKALTVELPKNVKIGVNAVYPTALPLATFPGNLLAALPELPKEVEYRIVGRHLILRDVTGNVIVDLMRDVFPIPV